MLTHPGFDGWGSLDCTGKSQKLAHGTSVILTNKDGKKQVLKP
jgi:hypothetical protein